jgi:hypothetical protein
LMIETLIHMDITVAGGVKALKPGDRVDIPIEKAKKLFKLAGPRKVRIILESANIRPGVWVEFFSPLFGMCTARIHEVTVDECIITNHSVLKGEGEPVTIPSSWICRLVREQAAS